MLKLLLAAFSNFVIVDEYVIMLELIKTQLKHLKKQTSSKEIKEVIWLLSKFMIALDIHFYIKNGSISNAATSIFDFINVFKKFITYQEQVKLIQTAFYMISVSKFGSPYVPDYALRFLDYGFDLGQHYEGLYLCEDVLNMTTGGLDETPKIEF